MLRFLPSQASQAVAKFIQKGCVIYFYPSKQSSSKAILLAIAYKHNFRIRERNMNRFFRDFLMEMDVCTYILHFETYTRLIVLELKSLSSADVSFRC